MENQEGNFIHAKRIVDFYLMKLDEDLTPEARFAAQYAHLKLMGFRAQSIVNSLASYPIEVK
jgi:hypothetical protein